MRVGSAVVIWLLGLLPSPSQTPRKYGAIGRSSSGSTIAPATAMAWFARAGEPTISVAAIFSVVTRVHVRPSRRCSSRSLARLLRTALRSVWRGLRVGRPPGLIDDIL